MGIRIFAFGSRCSREHKHMLHLREQTIMLGESSREHMRVVSCGRFDMAKGTSNCYQLKKTSVIIKLVNNLA